MTAPAGALVDATKRKKLYVIVPGVCTVLASAMILVSQSFWVVAVSQVATAVAGAAIGPAVIGITLGIARQAGFGRQNGRNQAFNHAGKHGWGGPFRLLGWKFGFPAVLVLAAVFGVLSIVSVLMIPSKAIDDRPRGGLKVKDDQDGEASGLKVLFRCKPLLILAASLACFHLGNGAMLPMFGMAVVGAKQGNPAVFVAETIVIAQGVMIAASLVAMRMADRQGYWLVLLISFVALPVRGIVASQMISAWGLYPVQFLDGIGAGLQSVAVPGAGRPHSGTAPGRVNVGQGAVLTVQGVGAALSPAIGGWLAQLLGYPAMFLILGSFALASVALWVGFGAIVKPSAAGQPA